MQALARRFVPAADEVGRLQRGDDAECRLFQAFAEEGHYAGRTQPSNTRQGIYAVTPDGGFLASVNTRSARQVAQMLRQALQRFEGREPDAVAPTAENQPAPTRFENRFPHDGLVLQVLSRDLPREPRPRDWRAHAWNLDWAWFRKDEVEAWLPEPEVGANRAVPRPLVARLARCHLLDTVRGQTPAYSDREVERAELQLEVVAVDERELSLRLTGHTRCERRGRWSVRGFAQPDEDQSQGVECALRGRARWDRAAGRFVAFELVGSGTRWGATQFNGRGDDLDPAPVGFVLRAVDDPPRVAPASWWAYGW